MPDLSIVIPVYNEADNLPLLLAEIHHVLEEWLDFEVIVVDDASSDDTPARLRRLRRRHPRLRVLHHSRNSGQSAALLSGARAARSPWLVTLDGDGQNDPADIPRLLARRDAAPQAPALVIGHRRHRHDHWLRRLSSRVANAVRARLLGDQSPDTGCGIKLIDRAAFLALPHFNHMHRFLPALFLRSGQRIATLEVNHRSRRHGCSKYGLFDRLGVGIVDLVGVIWLQHRPCQVGFREEGHG